MSLEGFTALDLQTHYPRDRGQVDRSQSVQQGRASSEKSISNELGRKKTEARTSLSFHLGNAKKCGPDFNKKVQIAVIYFISRCFLRHLVYFIDTTLPSQRS